MTTAFIIPGRPKGKGRPRINTKTHRAYTPQATKSYEDSVKFCYISSYPPDSRLHAGTVSVFIEAVFPFPSGWSKAKKQQANSGIIQPTGKPDLDNIAKVVLDALNGIAYTDDSKVVELQIKKRYGECGFVAVRIDDAINERGDANDTM